MQHTRYLLVEHIKDVNERGDKEHDGKGVVAALKGMLTVQDKVSEQSKEDETNGTRQ